MQGLKGYIVVTLLFLGIPLLSQGSKIECDPVFYVNGVPITKGEFIHFAKLERVGVIQYVRNTYRLEFCENFWDIKCNGSTPKELLIKRTIDTLIYIKIQQILAQENGLVNDISYSGFLTKLSIENTSRLNARYLNEPIYGPVQYSELSYYNYLFSNMVIRLKEKLNEVYFQVNEENLTDEHKKEEKLSGNNSISYSKTLVKAMHTNQLYSDYICKLYSEVTLNINYDIINSLEF